MLVAGHKRAAGCLCRGLGEAHGSMGKVLIDAGLGQGYCRDRGVFSKPLYPCLPAMFSSFCLRLLRHHLSKPASPPAAFSSISPPWPGSP